MRQRLGFFRALGLKFVNLNKKTIIRLPGRMEQVALDFTVTIRASSTDVLSLFPIMASFVLFLTSPSYTELTVNPTLSKTAKK